jgi:excisionase family DNA binding protein
MSEEILLTPDEVAERLKISRFTVMDYLRAGRIKAVKVGRLWRIKESDLRAFLDQPTEPEKGGET